LAPDEPEVEYAGEAARSAAERPVLKLHGDTGRVSFVRESNRVEPRSLQVDREGSTGKPTTNAQAMRLYHQSFQQLREGRHSEAAEGFRNFLRQFSGHDLADNAQYWLGESFYDRKDFSAAVREFRRVIERYPVGNKVPDALLKVGFSYLALGSTEVGRQTLEQVQRSYPRHEAAALAATRLSELEGDSHPQTGSSFSSGTAHLPKEVP
jgi:tol-pal system protein YbgF